MKDILFFGGSTGNRLHEMFAKIFLDNNTKEYNLINLAQVGAGNFYMAGMFFEYIKNNKKPDYVFFNFTGLNRWDLPFNKKVKLNDYGFQSIPGIWPEGQQLKGKDFDKNWAFSGGYAGSWRADSVLQRIFTYIYDLKDQNSTNMQSWQQVFSCISLCEKLNIPYNWTFYYDVTNPPSESSKQDGHETKFPDYISKKQMLEISPLNFAYSIDQAPVDGNHYSQKVEEKYFKEEIIFNKINNIIKNI
jgi:hypothetical protein